MKKTRIIFAALILMTLALGVDAQSFYDIQQYSTPLLLNPSFAGSTKGDRLYASLQTTHRQDTKAYLKFLSHDFYYKKKALGFGIIGGVISESGKNLYSPFFTFAGAKYIDKGHKRFLIPSFALGFEQPMKDYTLFFFDQMMKANRDVLPPGETLVRTTNITAQASVLFTDYNGSVGLSAKAVRSYQKNPVTEEYEEASYHLLVHVEKIFTYYQRDLLSREYLIRPRFVLDLGNENIQLFSEVSVKHKKFQTGLGFLPNFGTGNTRFSLTAGYDFKYFKVTYLGSVLKENGSMIKPMHNVTLSVVFPELRRYGIPIPGIIRNL